MNKKAIALASVLAFGALVGTNEYLSSQAPSVSNGAAPTADTQTITEFKEGVHYKVVDTSSVTQTLNSLGIQQGESFEIFSYSCPACMMFDPILSKMSLDTGAKIHKLQLGFDNFPIAQVDYYLKKSLEGKSLNEARTALFDLMINSDLNFDKKVEALENFPASRAITGEEIAYLKKGAEEYSQLTRKLAVDMQISGTPTIIFHGKYEVLRQNLNTIKDFEELYKHLDSLSSKK